MDKLGDFLLARARLAHNNKARVLLFGDNSGHSQLSVAHYNAKGISIRVFLPAANGQLGFERLG